MFLHKYTLEQPSFAHKSEKGKSKFVIIAHNYNCCYTCYFFKPIDFISEFGKSCDGFPEKLDVNNGDIQIYMCDKYKPVKKEIIAL